ncbi:MAG TPA: hypothetical protein VK426_03480 [Methanobacterium sp.]|nr:hypothetical protein [Methanobacterium sp.]
MNIRSYKKRFSVFMFMIAVFRGFYIRKKHELSAGDKKEIIYENFSR